MSPLLSVKNIRVSLDDVSKDRVGWVLRGIDLSLDEGERLALVGESGCGKSITALSILHLLPSPPMKMVEGRFLFKGRDLNQLSSKEWERIRGREIGIVFQDPVMSLNPVLTVRRQIGEVIKAHRNVGDIAVSAKVLSLLNEVGLPDVERLAGLYPHQLSGGMCQRVMIAMAIACEPALLIADEPTTALDVTVQAQILDLLSQMTEKHHLSVLLITHDLRVARGHADRVAILYAGEVVEEGVTAELFAHPQHPYTEGLLAALPEFSQKGKVLSAIPGSVPSPFQDLQGCSFYDRCPRAKPPCKDSRPLLEQAKKGHIVRCFYPSGK